MPEVLCICSNCEKSIAFIDGFEVRGRLVSTQTRRNHERSDKGPTSASSSRHRDHQSRSCETVHKRKTKSKGDGESHNIKLSKLIGEFRNSTARLLDADHREIGMRDIRLALREGGASRSVANSSLQAIRCLIAVVFTLLEATLAIHGITLKVPSIGIPHDIRSAYRRFYSEPKYTRVVCCPKCFLTFPNLETIPLTCPWRPSSRAKVCGADLWKQRRTRKGIKSVPACWFTTQES